jgi:hypothetical protein
MEGDPSHKWKLHRAQWRRIVSSPEIFDSSLVRWPASNRIDSLASAVKYPPSLFEWIHVIRWYTSLLGVKRAEK